MACLHRAAHELRVYLYVGPELPELYLLGLHALHVLHLLRAAVARTEKSEESYFLFSERQEPCCGW